MNRSLLVACTLSLFLPAGPVLAVVCDNIGTPTTVAGATDSGDGTALACGDDARAVGTSSVALGLESRGNGNASVAIGVEATADGGFGAAIGLFSDAGGASSIALGNQADVSGDQSIAMGSGAQTPGDDSVTAGPLAFNKGDSSVAIGDGAEVTDISPAETPFGAIAVGHDATTLGNAALAIGDSATSTDLGVALGAFARATGIRSTAIGFRAQATGNANVVIGEIPGVNGGLFYNDVGLGITEPLAPLHVFRDDDTREFLFLESNDAGGPQDRPMMFLANNGGIRFEFENSALATAWRFQAATGNQDTFQVTKVGTGQIEMELDAAGNLEIQGTLTELSDRAAKQDVRALDGARVLERLSAMPVSEWSYKASPERRHVGPMAQDFHAAFGLGADPRHISARDMAGVSLAAIQALATDNDLLEASNRALLEQLETLQAQNAALAERLSLIEALVLEAQPRTAQQ
jgi:hypothetical protein